MTADKLFEVLGDVSEDKVAQAEEYTPARPRWRRWAALVACLTLVLAGAIFTGRFPKPVSGGGQIGQPNGAWPEGVDPIVASVAVYPEGQYTIYDVEDATTTKLTQEEAYAFEPLGAYLPLELPEGYSFYNATLYETTMKDGTKFYMLRTGYSKGSGPNISPAIDGETGEPIVSGTGNEPFILFPMNYKPEVRGKIFDAGEITARDIEKKGGSVFHVSYGDVYMGISPYSYVSAEDFLTMIQANIK